ncbi:MAG: L,D-transpeptidase family protein [Pelovirga sp.]
MPRITLAALLILLLLPLLSHAWQPRLAAEAILSGRGPAPLVGTDRPYLTGRNETLVELAARAGVGYEALINANPDIDPWHPPAGSRVLLPLAALVPLQAQAGMTINLAELRLYLIWQEAEKQRVRIYPIGIGREGRDTPLGRFRVINRVRDPSWTPPPGIRAERPALPASIPPGPDNPLGGYWIGLSAEHIGLHGTNRTYGIGRQVSNGCIRLYSVDIEDLFARAQTGMPVEIIYQPVKLGQRDEILYLEVHPDQRNAVPYPMAEILRQRDLIDPAAELDWNVVRELLRRRDGIPQPVSPEAWRQGQAPAQEEAGTAEDARR